MSDQTLKFDDAKPAKGLVEHYSELKPGYALDAGCGKGKNAIWLAGNGWKVDAFEPREDWLSIAKERSLEKRIDTISFFESDIASYKPEQDYDLVVCALVLHFLPAKDTAEAIEKLKAWTKLGGRLYVSVMTDQNPDDSRPTLFHKDQLKSYFSDWIIEHSYQVKTDPLLMKGKAKPQVQYFDYVLARKLK